MSQELKNKYKIRSENEYKYIVNKNVVIPGNIDKKRKEKSKLNYFYFL